MGLLILFYSVNLFFPLRSILFLPVFMLAMPYIIVKSLSFNARMSAWRNVRFKYEGTYWKTLFYFIVLPVLSILSLGIAFPWVQKKQKEYLVNHYSFGGEPFSAEFQAKAFYKLYLKAIGLFLLFIPLALLGAQIHQMVAPVIQVVGYLLVIALVMSGTANIIYGNSALETYRFESRQKASELAWIYATKLLVIIATLGLAVPWAMIRLAQYRAESTTLLADEKLDHFTDQAQEEQTAIAEEIGDIFDIAVGI
jgi:uncharacterized membrane protein YjgN (DUF898 family)